MFGYVNNIKDFLNNDENDVLQELKSIYPEAEHTQIQSWQTLIKDLKSTDNLANLPKDTVVAIEYSLPSENMAIDLIIAFKDSNNQRHAFLIESKQWNDEYINKIEFSKNREFGKELHPQIQCQKYYYCFRDYLDVGKNYVINPIVFIRNCSQKGLDTIIRKNPEGNSKIPCFNKMSEIINYILNFVNNDNKIDILEELRGAEYKPSKSIINAMSSVVSKETPFILTKEQELSLGKIRNAIKEGKKVIRITGVAGSGKTAILLYIFVAYLKVIDKTNNIPIFISGAQNTSLYRFLYNEVKDLFEYSYSLNKKIPKTKGSKYIVLMDEAQHNNPGIISEIANRGATMILCYDEKQTINAKDSDTLVELKNLEKRSDFVSIELENTVRYNGSQYAEKNIKNLLCGNTNFEKDEQFEFKLFTNFIEFQEKIIDTIKQHSNSTVAVTGLLSNDAESYTYSKNSDSIFYTNWGKEGECKWIPYIRNKNYLSQNDGKLWVGTWWLPGLDVDYVGVIIGGDAKLTKNGLIGVPEQAKHYQMMVSIAEKLDFLQDVIVMRNSFGKQMIDNKKTADNIVEYINNPNNADISKKFNNMFSEFLTNNYYITLTRGRKGCFVYFANNEIM